MQQGQSDHTTRMDDILKILSAEIIIVSKLLCMFNAANTRWPATTSSVFEFDFEMEFLKILPSV